MCKYKQIIVGVDESTEGAEVFKKALEIALSQGNGLFIVSAIPYVPEKDVINTSIELGMPSSLIPGMEYDKVIKGRKEYIEKYANEAKATGIKEVSMRVEVDSPLNLLLNAVDDFSQCLIVVGAKRFAVGSIAKHIIAKASCDVLVVKSYS